MCKKQTVVACRELSSFFSSSSPSFFSVSWTYNQFKSALFFLLLLFFPPPASALALMHNHIGTRTVILSPTLSAAGLFDVAAAAAIVPPCGQRWCGTRGRRTEIDEGMALPLLDVAPTGPSKVENLDIIAGSAGRSGNPIRSPRNALKASATTSADSDSFFPFFIFFLFLGGAGISGFQRLVGQIPNIRVSDYPLRLLPLLFILHFDVLISGPGPCFVPEIYILPVLPSCRRTLVKSFCCCLSCGITFACRPIQRQEMTVSVSKAGISL